MAPALEAFGLVLGTVIAIAVIETLWRRRPRRRQAAQLEKLYDEWIADITRDERHTLEALLEHIKHHVDEGKQEGISSEWLASIENLIEIIRVKQNLFEPAMRHKLERLYLHWRNDPQNMTPPPVMKSFRRLMRVLPDPPDEQPPRVQRREEVRLGREEPDMSDSRWHGS